MKHIKLILTALALFCALALTVPATDAAALDEKLSGTCGENLTWTLTTDGTLTISGTGAMENYPSMFDSPWLECNDQVEFIVISDGVTSIGNYAFNHFFNLMSITIPNSVRVIGNFAFENCYEFDVFFYGTQAQWDSIDIYTGNEPLADAKVFCVTGMDDVFVSGTCGDDIEWTLTVGGALTISGSGAMDDFAPIDAPWYYYLGTLRSAKIEEGVTSVGSHAFTGCSYLESVTLPDTLTTINEYAFEYCSSLTQIVIPDGVEFIGNNAFFGCDSLKSVSIPDSVTEIEEFAFEDCAALERVTIPGSIGVVGRYLFAHCTSLQQVTIGSGITRILESAFSRCTSLTQITIPDSVDKIGGHAFSDCAALESIKLPDSMTSIGNYAFRGCSALRSITIPDGIQYIGSDLLRNCTSLESVRIPRSVTTISNYAFDGCTSLSTVTYTGTMEQWDEINIRSGNDALLAAEFRYVLGAPSPTASVDAVTGKPTLTWEAVPGAEKYEIFRCDTANGTYIRMITITGTTYTNGTAVPGQTYYYKVRAVRGTEYSACSAVFKVKCILPEPAATAGVNTATGKPTLTWDAVPGAEKYEIFRCDTPNGTYIRMTTITGTTYTNGTAVAGKTYYYKVRAVIGSVTSTCAEIYEVTCAQPFAQTAPVVTSSVNGKTGKPMLTWDAVPGAEKYEIFRCDTAGGTYIRMYTTTDTTYTNGSAVAGKTYYYKVRAVVGTANSACSTVLKVTCVLPAPVVSGYVNLETGKPLLIWEPVPGAEKYEIFRCDTANGTYIRMTTTTGTVYTNGTAEVGKIYYYKVRAVAGSVTGVCSVVQELPCMSPTETELSVPRVTGYVNSSTGRPMLMWLPVSGAEKYEIFRCDTPNGTYIRMTTVTVTTYVNGTAVPGQTYYYKVRAVKGTTYSSCSEVIKLTCVPATPVVVGYVNEQTGKPMLRWNAVPGAEKYEIFRCDTENGTYIRMTTITGTVYTNGIAEEGKTYYYKVRAVVGTVTSACSTVQKVTCVAPATAVSAE